MSAFGKLTAPHIKTLEIYQTSALFAYLLLQIKVHITKPYLMVLQVRPLEAFLPVLRSGQVRLIW